MSDRINDCKAKVVVTSDGNFRGNKTIPVKNVVDEALNKSSSVESVLTIKRTNNNIQMVKGRDYWYDELVKREDDFCKPENMNSEDILFILSQVLQVNQKGCSYMCRIYDLLSVFF